MIAEELLKKKVEVFQHLCNVNHQHLEEWQAMSREPSLGKDGEVISVYKMARSKGYTEPSLRCDHTLTNRT